MVVAKAVKMFSYKATTLKKHFQLVIACYSNNCLISILKYFPAAKYWNTTLIYNMFIYTQKMFYNYTQLDVI